mmetsp:Transcript_81018/g.140724  ORF Transcript_81018/g.140724 Transcript_81018/m.140724 type:complete len:217 (+) Transcript_81018:210-860(+)
MMPAAAASPSGLGRVRALSKECSLLISNSNCFLALHSFTIACALPETSLTAMMRSPFLTALSTVFRKFHSSTAPACTDLILSVLPSAQSTSMPSMPFPLMSRLTMNSGTTTGCEIAALANAMSFTAARGSVSHPRFLFGPGASSASGASVFGLALILTARGAIIFKTEAATFLLGSGFALGPSADAMAASAGSPSALRDSMPQARERGSISGHYAL